MHQSTGGCAVPATCRCRQLPQQDHHISLRLLTGADQLKQQKEHELAEARSLIQALQQEQQIAARRGSQEKVRSFAVCPAGCRSRCQASFLSSTVGSRQACQMQKSLVSRLSQPKQQAVQQSAPGSRAVSPSKQAPAAAVTAAVRPEAAKGGSKPAGKGVEGTAQSPRIKSASSQQPVQKVRLADRPGSTISSI